MSRYRSKMELASKMRIHCLFFLFGVFFTFVLFNNFIGYERTKDFECVPGKVEITNINSELRRGGTRKLYDYVITWYRDGECFQRECVKQLDKPDDSITDIWVNKENTYAVLDSPSKNKKDLLGLGVLTIVFITLGFITRRNSFRNKPHTKDSLESLEIVYFLVLILAGIFLPFFLWILLDFKDEDSLLPVEFLVVDLLTIVICLIGLRKTKVKLKK